MARLFKFFFPCLLSLSAMPLLAAPVLLTTQSGSNTKTAKIYNSSSNAVEFIQSALGAPPETPDCTHPEFGSHLRIEEDPDLRRPVFVFYMHVEADGDSCKRHDRQRNEIKTYGPSPRYLKGLPNDTVSYRWKFKLDKTFKPSTRFTHIHQIKPGDGPESGPPLITLTPRATKEGEETLQIIHQGLGERSTLAEIDLAQFKGQWVSVYEKISFGSTGSYSVSLKPANGKEFHYSKSDLDMWRSGSTFMRPKWGLYRSLLNPEEIKDEVVRFTDFCLANDRDDCLYAFEK